MNRTYTDLIKFISAIAILVHHFYLKNPAVTSLGFVACGVFFFFSAYDISKSLQHNPIRFGNFCKKRLLKIYMPLLLVNLITLLLVSPICNDGSFGIPIFHVFCDNITFLQEYSILDVIQYLMGWKKMDSVTWFLDVLLVSYILIWGINQLKGSRSKNIATVASYGVYIICCAISPPIWYVVDVVGVMLGLLVAFNEKFFVAMFCNKSWLNWSMGVATIVLLFLLYFLHGHLLGRYAKPLWLLATVLPVLLVMQRAYQSKLGCHKIVTILAGMSYFIYLIHVKVANMVNLAIGQSSFLLSLLLIMMTSYVLYILNLKILRRK